MNDRNAQLRQLPAVSALLQHEDAADLVRSASHAQVVDALRGALDDARRQVLDGAELPGESALIAAATAGLEAKARPGLCRVVNATGVVLHTGLGRAVLPRAAIDALVSEAAGYCLLANDPDTNERGRRERFCEDVLRDLTGCESASVVNNNAAAVLLTLNTLAAGKEVLISRGQLVEIGGSYRMPDVMAAAGCRMVEVGCTNRTHLRDYEDAITEDTAAIIRVHTSNYRIQGFSKEVSIEELCELGRKYSIPVIDDLGSGALFSLREEFDEPLVGDSIASGAALVTCSADKLFGGPQGGIILGSWKMVRRCEKNQMSRALRVGKLDLIALEATLKLFRDRDALLDTHPTARMLSETVADVTPRAEALAAAIREAAPGLYVSVEDGESYAGSGALPIKAIPSRVVVVVPPGDLGASAAAKQLRLHATPVFARVKAECLLLDPRTIQPGEDAVVVEALAALA